MGKKGNGVMAKKSEKIEVETKFANGSISFKMIDDRLVKLTKSTIDDIMDLIAPGQYVRGDMVGVFIRYYLDSAECIAGPDGVQKEEWDSKPRWQHRPYLWPDEFIQLVGLLHDKDLTLLADFAKEVQWRNGLAYRSWHRQNQGGGYYDPEKNSKVETTIVDPETWEEMKQGG